MILDDTINIWWEVEIEETIGSGTYYENQIHYRDVPAKIMQRKNLPEAKELVGGYVDVQYNWVIFIPRYYRGTEYDVSEGDEIEWEKGESGGVTGITGIKRDNLYIHIAVYDG